jgi:hypothetical protein
MVNNQSNTGANLGEPLPDDIRNNVVQFKDAYPADQDDLMRKHQKL